MEKNSHNKKIYCEILKEEIPESRCNPESQDIHCKSCSQYSKKIRTKRWDYVKEHLLYLGDGGHHIWFSGVRTKENSIFNYCQMF
jgi:hypothetical protein